MGLASAAPSWALYRRLLRYVLPYRRTFAIGVFSMMLLAATEPLLPALLKPLLDGSFFEQDAAERLTMPGLIVLLFLVRGGVDYSADVSIQWVAQKVVMDLRAEMFRRIAVLPTGFFDQVSSGELISKVSFDVAQVAQAATRGLTVVVKDALAISGLLAYMIYVNWLLSLVVFSVAPVVALVILSVSQRLRRMSQKVQQSMGAITQIAQETVECHKAVKVFGGQDYETGRFHKAINHTRQFTMKVVTAASANVPINQLVMSMVLAAVTYLAASQSAAGKLTVGEFVSFFAAMTLLMAPIKRVTGINEHLQRGLAAAQSVFGLIDEPAEPDFGTLRIGRTRGEVCYDNVALHYLPGHAPALDAVSVTIAAGETVALVGASGSGKSSFANLLPRFYHPSRGHIELDGVNIEALTLESLRANIALVSQEVLLFNDTIRNNIAYGALRGLADEAVRAAAEAAHVTEFVRQLPSGFETLIGDNGVRLSGGQRQRLAIARAILKDAPLLILDEATSSLDTASERHIQEALENLRRGRTCIIIAHRLTTVENADRIIVLMQGRIAEIGSHTELIARQGIYTELHRLQFKSEAQ